MRRWCNEEWSNVCKKSGAHGRGAKPSGKETRRYGVGCCNLAGGVVVMKKGPMKAGARTLEQMVVVLKQAMTRKRREGAAKDVETLTRMGRTRMQEE
jgi:hypothetical protein